ncbi:MAG: pyrroline-5-carboxylate reductase [Planctomycetes bacterium]|nr:pyrroline-5-carboxylate reductase [Planctomycetota bacterium]
METIGIIGGGNMAEAIIKGILSSGMYKPKDIMASDVRPERLDYIAKTYKVKTTPNNEELVNYAKVVLICVKPQSVKQMLDGIEHKIRDNTLVISIAAGINAAYLAKRLSRCRIIRAMPNTPAMVGEGATALFSANADKAGIEYAAKLFSAVGRAVVVGTEDLMNVVTAVSGSGPAYFFLLMEEMVKAGVKMGLPADIAADLVCQTAKGAGMLANQAHACGESPAELRKKVTSPGGTTEAALEIFTEYHFDVLIQKAVTAACDRSGQLSS